jgi:CRP-like cAMP-binding protein
LTANKNEIVTWSGGIRPAGPLVLCNGWAYRLHRFADGRRQILSVLIPGDLISAFAIGNSQPGFQVQAATDIRYCELGHDDIRRLIAENSVVCDLFGKFCAQESDEATAALIHLNQSNAIARVVNFIDRLVKRLAARGHQIGDDVYPFPMSYADMADSTGLTADEINRVIGFLHRERVIDLSNDQLTIINPVDFETNRSAFSHGNSLGTVEPSLRVH